MTYSETCSDAIEYNNLINGEDFDGLQAEELLTRLSKFDVQKGHDVVNRFKSKLEIKRRLEEAIATRPIDQDELHDLIERADTHNDEATFAHLKKEALDLMKITERLSELDDIDIDDGKETLLVIQKAASKGFEVNSYRDKHKQWKECNQL